MNRADFLHTGGFPLTANTLDFMQSSYRQLAALAGLGGQNYILSGCEVTGGNVSDGVIVIDGEVLPFMGGAKLAQVDIEETVENKTFEDGLSKPVQYSRKAKMVASGGLIDFDTIKRAPNLMDIESRMIGQSVGQWTPSNSSNFISVTSHNCNWLNMGKLLIVWVYAYFVYTGNGIQTGFSLEGLPNFGEHFGVSGSSITTIQRSDQSEPPKVYMCNYQFGESKSSINFTCEAPKDISFRLEFNLTTILQ